MQGGQGRAKGGKGGIMGICYVVTIEIIIHSPVLPASYSIKAKKGAICTVMLEINKKNPYQNSNPNPNQGPPLLLFSM